VCTIALASDQRTIDWSASLGIVDYFVEAPGEIMNTPTGRIAIVLSWKQSLTPVRVSGASGTLNGHPAFRLIVPVSNAEPPSARPIDTGEGD
jgi:hypothetical protein